MTRCNRNALTALCLGEGLLAVGALGHWRRLPLSAHLAGLCAGVGVSCMVLALLLWKYLLAHVDPRWTRVLIALLPAVLVALVIRAVARYVRDSDEMQRRIELEPIAIAAGLVSGADMTGGFLQAAELIDIPATVAMLWVFPMVCAIYGVTRASMPDGSNE